MTIEKAEEAIKRQVHLAAVRFEDLALSTQPNADKKLVEESLVTNIMRIIQAIDEGL